MNTHPLQVGLDRASTAVLTLIDLLDIAKERKGRSPSGRSTRPDARQASLYRAIVASGVAVIEDSIEALTVAALSGMGIPDNAVRRMEAAIARSFQSPNPDNINKHMSDYLGISPISHWAAALHYSPPAYSHQYRTSDIRDRREIHTAYRGPAIYTGDSVSRILSRFIRIRNSFAHQDLATSIFSKSEMNSLRALRSRKARDGEESDFVEELTTTCAVVLNASPTAGEEPLISWTLHETHATNMLRLCLGIISSTCGAVSDLLEQEHGVSRDQHEPLIFRVQSGAWQELDDLDELILGGISGQIEPYRPNSRGK